MSMLGRSEKFAYSHSMEIYFTISFFLCQCNFPNFTREFPGYFFVDDGTLMEIDISAKTCRSLMAIAYYSNIYLDEPNLMFLETVHGLSIGMYLVNFSEMTLMDTFRL